MTTYTLGSGCFWCLDALYRRIKGVTKVVSGYAGGKTKAPHYYEVASGETGHAEVVEVTFDETAIPKDVILDIFFSMHDPTTLNRQSADIGTQYRSILLYKDNEQKVNFEQAKDKAQQLWPQPIVTEITPLDTFYPAEEEHQNYFTKHPDAGYCNIVIEPKLVKARHTFKKWLKEDES
jgi:peptide-methionine (S)-S-oxide reductase